MELLAEDILKIALALVMGGAVGLEREVRDKAAGFRTVILITLGSTLFTIMSIKLAGSANDDNTRITAAIVSGVGFLGAGAILQNKGRIRGLTTAATIWIAAAIGMGIGGGDYLLTGVVCAVVLLVLWVLPYIEGALQNQYETRRYEITCAKSVEKIDTLSKQFKADNLVIKRHVRNKEGDNMICIWELIGKQVDHDRVMQQLFEDSDVIKLEHPES